MKMLGRLDEALASIEKALGCEPNSAVTYNNRGTVLHEQRRFDEAVDSYQKALAYRSPIPRSIAILRPRTMNCTC